LKAHYKLKRWKKAFIMSQRFTNEAFWKSQQFLEEDTKERLSLQEADLRTKAKVQECIFVLCSKTFRLRLGKLSFPELDEGFFQQITTPLQTASGLMVNMEAFMKQLEVAKKQSAMEKEKAEKEKKELEAKDKKFKDGMAKADELEKEGKFREAWMKVPEITDYPEKADEIRKRKSELSNQFSSTGLFATEQPTV